MTPSESDTKDVILVWAAAILMEATLLNLSLSHTSMVPHFVPVNMKSLFMAMRWMSSPVDSDPTTAFDDSDIIYNESMIHDNIKSDQWDN